MREVSCSFQAIPQAPSGVSKRQYAACFMMMAPFLFNRACADDSAGPS
jgi:hypothetical protein